MSASLRKLTITFTPEGSVELAVCYLHSGEPANPGTRRRTREVGELVRAGIRRVFDALEGGEIVMVGESGFEVREDVIAVDERS